LQSKRLLIFALTQSLEAPMRQYRRYIGDAEAREKAEQRAVAAEGENAVLKQALGRANEMLVERGEGAVAVEAPATGAAAGTPEPMRGVGAGAGVAGGHDEDEDDAILMSSPEVFALCDEAERQAAAAAAEKQAAPAQPPPPPADDEVFDEVGEEVEREQEAASAAAAAAAAAAASGSTGGVCGSPPAGGKRGRSPTKAGQPTPSDGRGNPSPKPDLSGLAKMQLSTE
jgi:hypothetical protein